MTYPCKVQIVSAPANLIEENDADKALPSDTVRSYLKSCAAAVAKLPTNPFNLGGNNEPAVAIPYLSTMLTAAAKLDDPTDPHNADRLLLMQELLRRAGAHGLAVPTLSDVVFPAVHHLHPTMGTEWYYVGVKFPIKDAAGAVGEVAVLASLQKKRILGIWEQAKAGWSDKDTLVLGTVATASVRINGKATLYSRRPRHLFWGKDSPDRVNYSAPTDPTTGKPCLFDMTVGDDYIRSLPTNDPASPELLPIRMSVGASGDSDFQCRFTLHSHPSVDPQHGWFLQGNPTVLGPDGKLQGNGLTVDPTPGFYYSWPQVVGVAEGDFVFNGQRFTVTGAGNAWIDHQLLQQSLNNASPTSGSPTGPVSPIPFLQDPAPINGWNWMFCNIEGDPNLAAYTQCLFQKGSDNPIDVSIYGYSISLDPSTRRFEGTFDLAIDYALAGIDPTLTVTAPAGQKAGDPWVSSFTVPAVRYFQRLTVPAGGGPGYAKYKGTSWDPTGLVISGDFDNPSWTQTCELPVVYTATTEDGSQKEVGWGIMETVGAESALATYARLAHYLETDVPLSSESEALSFATPSYTSSCLGIPLFLRRLGVDASTIRRYKRRAVHFTSRGYRRRALKWVTFAKAVRVLFALVILIVLIYMVVAHQTNSSQPITTKKVH